MEINENSHGQRIDNFMAKTFKGLPRSYIYRLIRSGQIRVNSKRVQPSYKLLEGDLLRTPPKLEETEPKNIRVASSKEIALRKQVLFEDEHILVFNKKPGQAVHGGSGLSFGIIELLRSCWNEHLELIHRLDRDTSGCLMVAKKRQSLKKLQDDFRNRNIIKKYQLVVSGKWTDKKKKVELPLLKKNLPSGQHIVKVDDTGKPSVTIFSLLKLQEDKSFLQAELLTGRTHQLRVHTSYFNHPILGDATYAKESFEEELKAYNLNRLYLHAWQLEFCHPASGSLVKVEAPLPDEWAKLELVSLV